MLVTLYHQMKGEKKTSHQRPSKQLTILKWKQRERQHNIYIYLDKLSQSNKHDCMTK